MLPLDPALFGESGELMALRVDGSSMINAGILDGDYVIIRRQSAVEEGEIAAVIVERGGNAEALEVEEQEGKQQQEEGHSRRSQRALRSH